ncbi:MAG: alpha/beta hydrolase [bacterium]|nr:alpha/beta hydrolase [bacterium]
MRTNYKSIEIEGVKIFYREAGRGSARTILLLHGFPSSSHMYRDLIAALSDSFHLLAPDYPGFGNSDCPSVEEFEYTFDNLAVVVEKFLLALGVDKFSLYMQDYGGPVGFRIAAKRPEWIQALIIQNANAYEEGIMPTFEQLLRPLWEHRIGATEAPVLKLFRREGTIFQYTHGARNPEAMNPDAWNMDQYGLDRPGNDMIQLDLQANYHTNLKRYPEWQAYFRQYQSPTLIVWGKNDPFFGPDGALAYKRDLKKIEVHMLDTGHFALEEDCELIAQHIRHFMDTYVR